MIRPAIAPGRRASAASVLGALASAALAAKLATAWPSTNALADRTAAAEPSWPPSVMGLCHQESILPTNATGKVAVVK